MAEFNVEAKAQGKTIGEDGYFEFSTVINAKTEAEARLYITQDEDMPPMEVISCTVMGGE